MRIPSLAAAAVFALTLAASATPSAAAPVLPDISKRVQTQSQAELVHWRGGRWHVHRWGHRRWRYCRNWRHECADRWGWGTWRYRRCLRRHGC